MGADIQDIDTVAEYEASRPRQMELFFLEDEENSPIYSNTIELYDNLPLFSVGRPSRDKTGMLKESFRVLEAKVRNDIYRIQITPAVIVDRKGRRRNYYPGAREELVEDCLRKMATERRGVFLDGKASVYFTFYELRKELQAVGHTYSIGEISEALEILAGTNLVIENEDGSLSLRQNLFTTLGMQRKRKGKTQRRKRGDQAFVRFHELVTLSIEKKTFRRYNYELGMSLPTEGLARRLYKRLSHHYTQAGGGVKPYRISLTRMIQDFGLKEYQHRGLFRAKEKVITALDELVAKNILHGFQKNPEYDKDRKNRVVNYIFELLPSQKFIHEAILANMHAKKIREDKPPRFHQDSSDHRRGFSEGMHRVGEILERLD